MPLKVSGCPRAALAPVGGWEKGRVLMTLAVAESGLRFLLWDPESHSQSGSSSGTRPAPPQSGPASCPGFVPHTQAVCVCARAHCGQRQ